MNENDMGVNCPGCGISITTGNAGGYGAYCGACATKVAALIEAQAVIVAMLNECGLASVKISTDSQYNRYTKPSWNGGGGVPWRFESLAQLADEMKPKPVLKQAAMFE